ncbi:GspH/FimT family pseudopilin [Marinobacter sp. C2H3]|uniref:GspH/FimT family pseudopilin n=1 Tax=Marinobacter sp. C2H3 TaxID=3119003 RepID=UPI00300EA6B6
MPAKRRHAGFTMIELLVTIIVLAIVASYALPSFEQTVLNNRLTSQVNDVSSLVAYARSEASKLDAGVITVCSSSDSASCSGSSSWEQGWIVFRDIDGDRVVDAGTDRLLKVSGPLSGGNTLRISGLTSDGGGYAQFASNGFPIPSATGAAAGTLTVCDSRGASEAKAVVINISGQTRLARDTGGTAGVVNNDKGNDVTCP